jgi:riboflavin kinase/FMN adenylyltransferase
MQVFNGIDQLPVLENPVVAVGAFDGVHLGHARILQFLTQQAAQVDGTSVVITFNPHPRTVLQPDSDFFTINNLSENLRLIEQQGVDVVIVLPFTETFSKMTYQQFVEDVLMGKLHAHTLVMGPNHAFGHHREGHHDNIKAFCQDHDLQVVDIPEEMWHSAGVHSALIREHIRKKEWETVNAMLGYEYAMKNDEY